MMPKWIAVGIALEKESISYYSSALKKVKDMGSIRLLEFLIDQEKEHLRFFERLKKEKNLEKGVEAEQKKLGKMKIIKKIYSKKELNSILGKRFNVRTVFDKAIDLEEKAILMYTNYASKSENPKIKTFLIMLAKFENEHRKLIKSHEDAVYNSFYWDGIQFVRLES